MKRYPDWRIRFRTFIEERRYAPFIWGENDCCLFACDAARVVLVGGYDFADGLRGRYSTAIGAARIFKKLGVKNVAELADLYCCPSLPRIEPAQATHADFMVWNGAPGGLPTLGTCVGEHAVFVGGTDGLSFARKSDCLAAYRI